MLCFGAEPGEESHGQATSGPSGGRVEGRAASCLWYTRGPQGKAPTPTHLSGERRATGVAAASGGVSLVLSARQTCRGCLAVQGSASPALGRDARRGR